MTLSLGYIRDALEGAIPAIMSTVGPDGVPNVAFLSQVHYVDERHVALSYQFFSKTRRNILTRPQAQLIVMHPGTAQMYRMDLRYLRTESSGPLFERMKAHLEGIASHTGMAGVFRLLGSDIYEVTALEAPPCNTLPASVQPCSPLAALRRTSEALSTCNEFGTLVDTVLDSLQAEFGVEHALLLMLDEAGERLYTVASRGYPTSGVGSEIAMGDGVIGVCAQARTAIRISWLTHAYRYSRTIRDVAVRDGLGNTLQTEIPYPGLAEPHSQLGLPIVRGTRLLGVLFVESSQDLRFTYDHEDALVTLAGHLAASMDALRELPDSMADTRFSPAMPHANAPQDGSALAPLLVRRYCGTDSIFFDDQYLIKGVAGAILWHLLREHQATGRTEFSNRELRLDPAIRLPDVVDNLEARLILLRRRLSEQAMGIGLRKSGRGRLSLEVDRALALQEVNPG